MEVYQIFDGPVLMLSEEPSVVIGSTHRGRFLSLVLDEKRDLVITLWPASRRQRRMYRRRLKS